VRELLQVDIGADKIVSDQGNLRRGPEVTPRIRIDASEIRGLSLSSHLTC
jgi:hypothetical protein